MPTMPQRVILNHKLRCDRRTEAQRERRGPIQLRIRKHTNRGGCLPAIAAQQFQCRSLGYPSRFDCMFGIQLGNDLPTDVSNRRAPGDRSRQINLDPTRALATPRPSPSANAASNPAPSSIRSANASARRLTQPPTSRPLPARAVCFVLASILVPSFLTRFGTTFSQSSGMMLQTRSHDLIGRSAFFAGAPNSVTLFTWTFFPRS